MSYLSETGLSKVWAKINTLLNAKQNTLVSGANIKTINGNSLLGAGNIPLPTPVWGTFSDSDRAGSVEIGDVLIQWGYASATPSGTGDVRTGTVTVTFDKSFSVRPVIMATLSNTATTVVNRVAIPQGQINTESFTATVLRSTNTATQFFWFAFGKK